MFRKLALYIPQPGWAAVDSSYTLVYIQQQGIVKITRGCHFVTDDDDSAAGQRRQNVTNVTAGDRSTQLTTRGGNTHHITTASKEDNGTENR